MKRTKIDKQKLAAFFISVLWCSSFLGAQTSTQSPKPFTPPKPKITLNSTTAPIPAPVQPNTLSDMERFKQQRRPPQLLSTTGNDDHEDAGVYNTGGLPYTGVFGLHTIFATDRVTLTIPNGATRAQTLFAPTTRAPNGACLEVGTAYTTQPGATTTAIQFYVYDFCKGAQGDWGMMTPVDPAFLSAYAGASVQGNAAYAFSVYTFDTTITSNSLWTAVLYNYQTQQWDVKYTARGFARADTRGWSIFETWYQPGQCSEGLPLFSAEQLAYFNPTSQHWDDLKESMPTGSINIRNVIHKGGNCFEDNPSAPASYSIFNSGYDSWIVRSR